MESPNCRSPPLSSEKRGKFSVKGTEKVVCEWEVTVNPREVLFSRKFWHSGTTKWCVEANRHAGDLSVYFHLLAFRRDSSVKAELSASVKCKGIIFPEDVRKTVTLNAQQNFCLIPSVPVPCNEVVICGIVTTASDMVSPHTNVTLHRELRSVVNDLGLLMDSGDFSDIVLCAGGIELRAHRALLSARSPVFSAMLRHNMQEAQMGRVDIADMELDTLREVLRYMYTGQALHMEEMADKLLVAADKYDLPGLKQLCEHQLAKTLTVDNAMATAVLALSHSCSWLKWSAIKFIKMNLVCVMGSDGWAASMRHNTEFVAELCHLIAEETVD